MVIDREILDDIALVIDPNPTSRALLAAQLREFGLSQVQSCGRAEEAVRQLEKRSFDIVLCEQNFPDAAETGQQLLDELRTSRLLPPSTVVVLITGDASHTTLSEAADLPLDAYLVKPHTAATLGERLKQARKRKRDLAPIFSAIEAGRFDEATRLCLTRFQQRGPMWLTAARIGVDLLLQQGKTPLAKQVYDAVAAVEPPVPWARVGVARLLLESGQYTAAIRTLQPMVDEDASQSEAIDLLARAQLEQAQLGVSLTTCRQASRLSPASVTRLQRVGILGYYLAPGEETTRALERACTLGTGSRLLDPQAWVLLGFIRYGQRDHKGLQRCLTSLEQGAPRTDSEPRIARHIKVLQVLTLLLRRDYAEALGEAQALAGQTSQDDFDSEAALNLISLLSAMEQTPAAWPESGHCILRLSLRFCSGKAMTELMVRATVAHPPHAERVRTAQQRVAEMAQQCMLKAVKGHPQAAVEGLLDHGQRTRNIRLVETARLALLRYQEQLADAAALSDRVESLRNRWLVPGTLPLLGHRPTRHTSSPPLARTRPEPALP